MNGPILYRVCVTSPRSRHLDSSLRHKRHSFSALKIRFPAKTPMSKSVTLTKYVSWQKFFHISKLSWLFLINSSMGLMTLFWPSDTFLAEWHFVGRVTLFRLSDALPKWGTFGGWEGVFILSLQSWINFSI